MSSKDLPMVTPGQAVLAIEAMKLAYKAVKKYAHQPNKRKRSKRTAVTTNKNGRKNWSN